jgi:hypothetical protein
MRFETPCNLGDAILIVGYGDKIPGRVVSFWFTSIGMQYEVVYWNIGKREKDLFMEYELEFQQTPPIESH